MGKKKTYNFSYKKEKGKLQIAEAQSCYCVDGLMRAGVGLVTKRDANGNAIKVANHITAVDEIFPVHITVGGVVTEYLGVLKTNGEGYYYNPSLNNGAGGWALFHNFGVTTKSIETQDETGKKRTFFCNENGLFYYTNAYGKTNIVKAKKVGCFFGGRMFIGVGANKLLYSSAYGYYAFQDTLSDGGYLILPSHVGEIVAITPFQNKLYVFCEYGIFEMYALGNAQDFTFKEIDYQGGKIFGDSLGVCVTKNASGIYFYTDEGFCVFDGKQIKGTCNNLEIEPMDGAQHYYHAEYDGKYQLSFLSQWGERKTLVIDCATGNGYYSFATKGTGAIDKQGYCIVDGEVCVLKESGRMPTGVQRSFICTDVDLGEKGVKTLCVLHVKGLGETTITVFDGKNSKRKKTIKMSLDGGESSARVFLRAETFRLQFDLDSERKGYIESITVDYETLP